MIYIVDASLRCNFEDRPKGPCTYCYNTPARREVQPQEITNVEAIEAILRKEYPQNPGSIILHGGEPLYMKKKTLEKLLKISFELSGESAIQTNASLVDDKKIELLKRYKTRVGVSIDGYWPANQWRGKTKEDTDRVIENIFKLKNAGIPTAVLITLHKDNADSKKIKYVERFVLDLARKEIPSKINLIYHPSSQIELPTQEAKRAYLRLAEFVLKHSLINIAPFQSIITNLLGAPRSECMFENCDPYCTLATHITAKGIPSLCGRFMTEVYYRGPTPTSMRWEILRQTDCKGCPYAGKICFGGCPGIAKDWDWRNKDRFCEVFKALFEFFEKRIKFLVPFLLLKTDPGFQQPPSRPMPRQPMPYQPISPSGDFGPSPNPPGSFNVPGPGNPQDSNQNPPQPFKGNNL